MKLTKEYIKEQIDCINTNYRTHKNWEAIPVIKNRYMALKKYCTGAQKILSVGSGGVEPLVIGATHALDVSQIAGNLLKNAGWEGSFIVGSCDKLPYKDNEFDVAVCSEVIEHLPCTKDVRMTFNELARVAKTWIVTTPSHQINDPGHKHVFTREHLERFTQFLKGKVVQYGIHFYIYNQDKNIF